MDNETFGRRQFIRLILLSGAAAGCGQVATPPPLTTTPVVITATPPVTWQVDLVLKNLFFIIMTSVNSVNALRFRH